MQHGKALEFAEKIQTKTYFAAAFQLCQ